MRMNLVRNLVGAVTLAAVVAGSQGCSSDGSYKIGYRAEPEDPDYKHSMPMCSLNRGEKLTICSDGTFKFYDRDGKLTLIVYTSKTAMSAAERKGPEEEEPYQPLK